MTKQKPQQERDNYARELRIFVQRLIKMAKEQILVGRNYGWTQDSMAQELDIFISSERTKAFEKGYSKATKEYEEWQELNADDEAHRTAEGYCCACGYDMAVMADKIKEERTKILNEIREMIKNIPTTRTIQRFSDGSTLQNVNVGEPSHKVIFDYQLDNLLQALNKLQGG